MGRKYQSVVRINRLAPPGVNLFVKIEAFNPLGSVKDRLALGVIEAHRGDKRKYGDRSRHGVRSQGIPTGGHHGRAI